KMSLPEAVKPASPGSNPDVMVTVLREAPDTGIRQTILFTVCDEALSVKLRQSAAVITNPKGSIVARQNGLDPIIRQSFSLGVHSNGSPSKASQPGAAGANPQVAVPIGVNGPCQ